MLRLAYLLPVFWIVACGQVATAASWTLEGENSRISFVSVKSGAFAEPHHFTDLTGSVAEDGTATVTIGLDSVETLIDIRNERMREFLFETDTFPVATVTAQVDLESLRSMAAGERRRETLTATLDLHGVTQDIEATVFVTRVAETRVSVETVDPVILNADVYGLTGGLNKLMELAGLDSITPDVPVTFSLVFDRAPAE